MTDSLDIFLVMANVLFAGLLAWLIYRRGGITVQKDGEADLYQQLFDHATDSIFITDFKGKILDVNDSVCSLLGYTKTELLNTHISA